jgi:hypothetical protein
MTTRHIIPGSLFIREFNFKNAAGVQEVVLAICYAFATSDIEFITHDLRAEEYPIRAFERNSDIQIHNV